jgi:hypothetical protein
MKLQVKPVAAVNGGPSSVDKLIESRLFIQAELGLIILLYYPKLFAYFDKGTNSLIQLMPFMTC